MESTIISLNQVMTITEAAERYGVKLDTLKSKFKPSVVGRERIDTWIKAGLVRQSGKTWLISETFMENNFKRN